MRDSIPNIVKHACDKGMRAAPAAGHTDDPAGRRRVAMQWNPCHREMIGNAREARYQNNAETMCY